MASTSIPVSRQIRYLDPAAGNQNLLTDYVHGLQAGHSMTLAIWQGFKAEAAVHELSVELGYDLGHPDKEMILSVSVSNDPPRPQVADDALDNLFHVLTANGQIGVFQDFLLGSWAIVKQMQDRSRFDRWLQVDVY